MGRKRRTAILMLAAGLAAAGSASDHEPAAREKHVEKNGSGSTSNLPFSHGRSFTTLDAYLAHLRDNAGPIGQPWYREIRRGVYELVSTARPLLLEEEQGRGRGREMQTFTREQLMERFGFTR